MSGGNGHEYGSHQMEGATCVVAVCAETEIIGNLSRVATELFSNPVVLPMQQYLPQNHDIGILQEMRSAQSCLCLIDFDGNRELALETASSFQRMLGSQVMLMAVAQKSSSSLIIDAMRAGCMEYLTKPVTADELKDAMMRLRARWTPPRSDDASGDILAFIGVRGGAGATTIVTHLASFLVRLCGKKVLIVDQQRQLGHVALYMGLPAPKFHFYDLVRNIERLDLELLRSFVMQSANGVDVIPAPSELFALTEATVDDVHRTLKFLRGLYDFVLIDCPHGLSRLNVATIDACNRLYLVATPDVPALRDLSCYVDRILQHYPAGKLNVVINRYRSKGEVKLEAIAKALNQPVAITIPNSGNEVIEAMNSGKPMGPEVNSEFSRQMRKWATSLVQSGSPMQIPPEPKRRVLAFWG
jgi:pilus assembly protein CpaE